MKNSLGVPNWTLEWAKLVGETTKAFEYQYVGTARYIGAGNLRLSHDEHCCQAQPGSRADHGYCTFRYTNG